jgi:hypothetical protein
MPDSAGASFFSWILCAVLVMFVFYTASAIVSGNSTTELIVLSVCMAVVLAVLVSFNFLKKKL